jgi:hypothetical protein
MQSGQLHVGSEAAIRRNEGVPRPHAFKTGLFLPSGFTAQLRSEWNGRMPANRYPGACTKCGGAVGAYQGSLSREGDRWLVTHDACTSRSVPSTGTKAEGQVPKSSTDYQPSGVQGAAAATGPAHSSAVASSGLSARQVPTPSTSSIRESSSRQWLNRFLVGLVIALVLAGLASRSGTTKPVEPVDRYRPAITSSSPRPDITPLACPQGFEDDPIRKMSGQKCKEDGRDSLTPAELLALVTSLKQSGTSPGNGAPRLDQSPESGPTALCVDGTLSYSESRQGTCSHHGGVREWYG